MNIKLANLEDLETIKNIVNITINEVYPLYYPKGAVDFFILHHGKKNILSDIESKIVYILNINNAIIGTITIKENHINRFFILPQYQNRGYGSILFNFAEKTIFKNYNTIILDTSLPSKNFYLKRNYQECKYNKILTSNGDYLCYDIMTKHKKYSCLCCGYKTFDDPLTESIGDICPVCYWEIDFFIKDDDYPSGANHGLTLNQARENFKSFGSCEKSMIDYVRKPYYYEL